MDQDPRKAEPEQVAESERTPEQIQAEIDATREQLGETVAAVGEKADIKGQARDRVTAFKQTARTRKDDLLGKARSRSPDSAAAGAQKLRSTAREKPLPFAVGGALLVGFLLGRRAGG